MRREIAAVVAAVVLAFVAVQIPSLPTLMLGSTFSGTVAVPNETQPPAVEQAKAARTQAGADAQAWVGSLTLIVVLPLMLAASGYLITKRAA